jgi:N-acetylglucosamine-6-phosphate deacetylase
MKVTDDSRPPNGFTIAAPLLFDGTAMRGPALVTISCGLIESVYFGEAPSRGI